jgi:hypothetical protein
MLPEHVNIAWISDHFDHKLPFIAFIQTYNVSYNKNSFEELFMRTIGSIKYRWDWISEDLRNVILQDLNALLEMYRDPVTASDTKKSFIKNFRTDLKTRKWVLM